MNRVLRIGALAASAAVAGVALTAGTAAAMPVTPGALSRIEGGDHHHHHDWDFDRGWHYSGHYRSSSHVGDYGDLDRGRIDALMRRYFGGDASGNTVAHPSDQYLSCGNEPGPGVSVWRCGYQPLPADTG